MAAGLFFQLIGLIRWEIMRVRIKSLHDRPDRLFYQLIRRNFSDVLGFQESYDLLYLTAAIPCIGNGRVCNDVLLYKAGPGHHANDGDNTEEHGFPYFVFTRRICQKDKIYRC
jgi:hypothetical protein